MSESRLERDLAGQLDLLSRSGTWPFPAPVRELHFDWCCEHPKAVHARGKKPTVTFDWCLPCDMIAFERAAIWMDEPDDIAYEAGKVAQHPFKHGRAWRFDFAWPAQKVAVECDGGTRSGGRHVRPLGYEADRAKDNAAVLKGWRVLHVTQREITSGEALRIIEASLKAGEA